MVWEIKVFWKQNILISNSIWIEIMYLWQKTKWEFFLHPHLDDNKKTVIYYAFDDIGQKTVFEDTLKLNWIWPKTAFQIAKIPSDTLKNAIKNLDAKFFQAIPWIGPKSAKKILLELKWNIDLDDVEKINIDQKLYKNIVSSLKWFGYDTDKIKSTLLKYEWKITKENLSDVVKRLVSNM